MKETMNLMAALLFLGAFVPYAIAILNGSAKPMKATWLIWASLDTITLVSMFFKDAVNGQIVGATAGAWIITALAMKYGSPGWTRLDKLCLCGAVVGVALMIFSDPLFGLIISLGVLFIGSIPTFESVWQNPKNENKLAWTMFWLSCVCAVIAIPQWTIEDAAQPITFFAIESVTMYILYISPLFKRHFSS